MNELRRDVRALHLESQDMDWQFCSNNPLTLEIEAISLPRDFKVSKDMFEGKRDPRAHLIQYNDYKNMLGASNAAKCKAFSTMLKGIAKDWYLSFLQGSVPNFSQLGQMFLDRLRAHRAIMNTLMGLMSVKQREGKSLQDYVKRFHAATLNTKNLEDQWAIDTFFMGVQNDYV